MVDAWDLKSLGEIRAGSNPAARTIETGVRNMTKKLNSVTYEEAIESLLESCDIDDDDISKVSDETLIRELGSYVYIRALFKVDDKTFIRDIRKAAEKYFV